MRKGWEYKKLGEICSSDLGKTLNKSKDVGNMHPYLCAINILWDSIDLTTLKEACFKDDEIDRYTVKYGDLLVCEGGDTGRAAIWDRKEPILYQNALHRLRFKEDVDARFIMYNLWHKKQIGEIDHKYSKGVTILHLVKYALLSIPILLPPLSTQLTIVSELDKINELIRLKKEQLKDFDNLAQSLFYEMFGDPVENEKGWEVKKLGELLKVIGGYAFKSDKYKDEGIPILRIGNINSGFFRDTNLVFAESDEKLEKYKIFPGDIVISLTGTVGKSDYGNVCIMDDAYNFYYLNQRNAKLEIFGNLDKYYLSAILKNEDIKSRLTSISRGVRQANIANKDIENLQIPLPPLPLQQLFAHRIEQIEHQKAEVQKSITDLETLLASRMQYWFE